jgi:hypothetical protein
MKHLLLAIAALVIFTAPSPAQKPVLNKATVVNDIFTIVKHDADNYTYADNGILLSVIENKYSETATKVNGLPIISRASKRLAEADIISRINKDIYISGWNYIFTVSAEVSPPSVYVRRNDAIANLSLAMKKRGHAITEFYDTGTSITNPIRTVATIANIRPESLTLYKTLVKKKYGTNIGPTQNVLIGIDLSNKDDFVAPIKSTEVFKITHIKDSVTCMGQIGFCIKDNSKIIIGIY